MTTISFVGDVMLGRVVGSRYRNQPYPVVSRGLVDNIIDSDYVIGNLESPVVETAEAKETIFSLWGIQTYLLI